MSLGRGFVVTLLLAGACGDGGKAAGGAHDGGTSGSAAGTGAAGTGAAGSASDGGVDWLTPPTVAPALVAPSEATVRLHLRAVGAQVYVCVGASGADAGAPAYAWALKAPDAELFDASGAQVGTHGAGPSWTYADGSVAKGTKVIELGAPVADAIPWLLLRVTSPSCSG